VNRGSTVNPSLTFHSRFSLFRPSERNLPHVFQAKDGGANIQEQALEWRKAKDVILILISDFRQNDMTIKIT
jgi:hypothetical protein